MPRSVSFTVFPARDNMWSLPANVTLVDIVRTNQFRRPIAFAITGGETTQSWLGAYTRPEGLYYRVLPIAHAPMEIDSVRSRLLHAEYRGFTDPNVLTEDVNRNIAFQYYSAAMDLLRAERIKGELTACRSDRDEILTRIPPTLVRLEEQGKILKAACG